MNTRTTLAILVLNVALSSCSDSERLQQIESTLNDQAEKLEEKDLALNSAERELKAHRLEFEDRRQTLESEVEELRSTLADSDRKLGAIRDHVKKRQEQFDALKEYLSETDPAFDELSMALFGVQAQLAMDGYEDIETIDSIINAGLLDGPNKTVDPTPSPPGVENLK